jgi:hypothetical protein
MASMQYALDAEGSWVNAQLTEYRKHRPFFCGCAERHPVKLVKPSGVLGKRPFSDYFAHITRSEHGSADGRAVRSCGCSESQDHFNAKHKLREMVGRYTFTTFRCISCRKKRVIYSRGCDVIIEKASTDRKWRFDCLMRRDGKDVVALEVLHSHKVTGEKATSVRDSGLQIAEFRAEDVLRVLSDSPDKAVHLENLLVELGKCQTCVAAEDLKWMRTCWRDECRELQFQELDIIDYYAELEYIRLLKACEAQRLVEEGMMWLRDCYIEELRELIEQEANEVVHYMNVDARNRKMLLRKKLMSEKFLSCFKRI